MDSRPNRRNKAAFSHFLGVVRTRPWINGVNSPEHIQTSLDIHQDWLKSKRTSNRV